MVQKSKKNKDHWALARTKFRLNSDQIAMAKELGLNPKKFGSLAPNKAEPWKGPLGEFIEECYLKRFKKSRHSDDSSIK